MPIAPFLGASPPCHAKGGGGLALARGRVAWLSLTSGMKDYVSVAVADLGGGAPRYFRELTNDQFGEGDAWTDIEADGATIVQGRVRYERDETCVAENDYDRFACPVNIVGGGVWRFLDSSTVRVPRVPPATNIAISGQRLLLAPARAQKVVEIRDLGSGALVSRTELEGTPLALALSPAAAAVLVHDRTQRIVVVDPATGAVRRSFSVASAAGADLALSGRTLVYSKGPRVWRLDLKSGRRTLVAVAGRRPWSLSIEGRRIAWVENRGVTSRIRSVVLP